FLENIGVRLKGNYGSYRTLDEKAAFLLDFNRYVPGQKFLGLEKLAVNNMVQDPSMQREVLGYRLFREGGAPAPRAGHAVVTVNGEPYGLYTTVEALDNNVYLDNWFDDHKANLYEGAYGSDLELEKVGTFDLDNGNNVDFADLIELILVLDGLEDPEQFLDVVGQYVDLDLYLTTAATGMYLGDWDGYYWSRNNYFMYRRPSDQRWVFMPWGIDQIMGDHLPPFEGAGRLTQMCNASLACRQALASKYEEVVARVEALQLAAEADTLGTQLWFAAAADPRKPYSITTVGLTVDANIAFLTSRGPELLDALICADPDAVDADNDGYNGCGEDCNDADPAVHPGAMEVCDLDDDDCDGIWDNAPMCTQCVIQPLPAPNTGDAAFCFNPKTWALAEADCVDQGGHLISIHDQAT
ncbi:MAG: CotH kinase family protein, partial [Myxococcales bacterium]|nr:CotH kinase family protein [Myxococcales bacterium]